MIWGIAALVQMVVIWVLSSRPGSSYGELPFPHADKLVHLVLFGALAFCWHRASFALKWARPVLMSIAITSLWGAIDEWHQFYVPLRGARWADWVFDTLGAVLAVSVSRRLPTRS